MDRKWERGGGGDRERSTSWDSNSGRPKRNGDTCRCAAHKAIGADILLMAKAVCVNY